MTKNVVLIPVERAEFSLQVLPYICRFLNPADNRLILLHVDPEQEAIHIHGPGTEDINIYVDESEAALRTWFADLSLRTVRELEQLGFAVTTDVAFGQPILEIEKYIAEHNVALVAIATHGRTGFDRFMHGSVAEHILHHMDIPLLLLQPKAAGR